MLVLPTEKIQAKVENPRFLILFGKPKAGKTTIVNAIPNNLIIDLEGGSQYMDSLAVQARTIADLGEIAQAIMNKTKELGKAPYDYITIDSGTVLEDIARSYALTLYQQTPMAKSKDGKIYNEDVLKLPQGAGYLYLREAFEKLWKMFYELAPHFILICHCKDALIEKDGTETKELAMDLTGKIARIVSAKADAIGIVYRKGNQTKINFDGGGDSICEARAKHLRGTTITIAESDKENIVTVDWTKIYLPENKENN